MVDKTQSSIDAFTDLYLRMILDRPFVNVILSGHLSVEFLLRRLIEIHDEALTRHADRLRHAELIALNAEIGTITDGQREVLVCINRIRNKLAHDLLFSLEVDELLDLFKRAQAHFSDMTDGIEQGIAALEATSSLEALEDQEWVLSELFVQISYDLHHAYVDRGGDIEEFRRQS